MGITAAPNSNYIGAVSANDKYNPLDPQALKLEVKDRPVFNWMLKNRIETLKGFGYEPSQLKLELAVKNHLSLIANEKGKRPPLVVVSSNRSAWIKSGLAECDEILKGAGKPSFGGIMDLAALTKREGVSSPPIYCPKRVNDPDRNVYVVVHLNEYQTYRQALDPYEGISVVGWNFPSQSNEVPVLVGFGASRFAAIEFCKYLHTRSSAVQFAWLFDDNVVGMSSKFAGLQTTEDNLKAGNYCCVGFAALPAVNPRQKILAWAKNGGRDPRKEIPEVSNFGPTFQQAVLWNIDYLFQNKINFGITYVASAEDVSLSRFIKRQELPSSFLNDVVVLKEVPADNQNDQGAQSVASARNRLERLFADVESMPKRQGEEPPPPVNVLVKDGDGTPRTVANFIETLVTKNQTDLNGRATCQAAEQITKTAIGLKWVDQGVQQGTFKKVQANSTFRNLE